MLVPPPRALPHWQGVAGHQDSDTVRVGGRMGGSRVGCGEMEWGGAWC